MVPTTMKINGLKASFNMPKKLKTETDEHGEETSHGLPPYNVQPVYNVDRYKACPTNWMNGSDIASSYFVKVEENSGMWLDFNTNFHHTHDVAVVLSIQGINPITGLKTDQLRLEQFKKKCPVHDEPFKSNRLCDKCGFEWPAQNYLTTTVTPNGQLWLDGFRAPDGKVRQYVFTEEEMKGVAAQLIGEDRVFAIGVAFYVSKEKKPEQVRASGYKDPWNMFIGGNSIHHYWDTTKEVQYGYSGHAGSAMFCRNSFSDDKDLIGASLGEEIGEIDECLDGGLNEDDGFENLVACSSAGASESIEPVKKFEIGAGAMIDQKVYPDTKELSYWEEKPSGMVYLNYCDGATFNKILKAGQKETVVDGFMVNLQKA